MIQLTSNFLSKNKIDINGISCLLIRLINFRLFAVSVVSLKKKKNHWTTKKETNKDTCPKIMCVCLCVCVTESAECLQCGHTWSKRNSFTFVILSWFFSRIKIKTVYTNCQPLSDTSLFGFQWPTVQNLPSKRMNGLAFKNHPKKKVLSK